jgi:hypothetical protein
MAVLFSRAIVVDFSRVFGLKKTEPVSRKIFAVSFRVTSL